MSRRDRDRAAAASAAEAAAVDAAGDAAVPSGRALGALAVIGGAATLWASVLWRELLRVRAGLDSTVCPADGGGGCAALWDAGFAKAVEGSTGIPIAAWGVAWGIVATLTPILALLFASPRPAAARVWVTATRVVAAAGVVSVLALLGASAAAGSLCRGCVGTYVLVALYAGIALFGWRAFGLPRLAHAAAGALALTVLALVGLRALGPKATSATALPPLAAASAAPPATAVLPPTTAAAVPSLPPGAPTTGRPVPPAESPGVSPSRSPASTGRSAELDPMVASLPYPAAQALSDALQEYRTGLRGPLPAPRVLEGSASSPVRITTFSDFLCSHCASLHQDLEAIRARVPADSVAVEPRHYPLDGTCNAQVRGTSAAGAARCTAAKAAICLERSPRGGEFRGRLYAAQQGLTAEQVKTIAREFTDPAALEACLADPATTAKLNADIAVATRYKLEGTPLVLVNGRRAARFPLFLYGIVLARGVDNDPAFQRLPPPRPPAADHSH